MNRAVADAPISLSYTTIVAFPHRISTRIHQSASTQTVLALILPLAPSPVYFATKMKVLNPETTPSGASVSDESSLSDTMSECSSISSSPSNYKELIIAPHVGYKKVLVTGGAGFVGSSVAEELLARGDDVVIVDEMNDYYDVRRKENNLDRLRALYPGEKRLAIYRGDICDEQLMHDVFDRERPQWICHMAARAGVRPSIQDPYVYIHSNIVGTTLLMELAHKFGVQLFCSRPRAVSMEDQSQPTFQKRKMWIILCLPMLPLRRYANCWHTHIIIYTSSTQQHCGSSLYTARVAVPTWRLSNLWTASAAAWRFKSLVMVQVVATTLLFQT